MKQGKFEFEYEVYDDISQLSNADAVLLNKARAVTAQAYAPYSKFNVGAVAILDNGEFVAGTNQEFVRKEYYWETQPHYILVLR